MAKKAAAAAKPAKAKTGGKGAGKGAGGRKKRSAGTAGSPPQTNGAGHNGDRASDDAIRANFLQHRSLWNKSMAALKVAEKNLKDMVASAKADGFLKREFQIADALAGSAKREAKVVGEVTTRLRVARWIGHAMGKQYDLFEHPPVQAASVDEAYDAGKQAAMEGDPATPPPQFSVQELSQKWLAGYQEGKEALLRKGIKPLEPKAEEAGKPTGAEDAPWEGKDPEGDRPPTGWGPSKLPPAAQTGSDL